MLLGQLVGRVDVHVLAHGGSLGVPERQPPAVDTRSRRYARWRSEHQIAESPMLYGPAADLVVVLHLAFIVFVLAGGFMAWRWPSLVWAHVPALAIIATLFALGADCPLTDLEKYLRREAGQSVYQDGFVAHYLVPGVPDGARAVGQYVLVAVLTIGAYVGNIARRRRANTSHALTRTATPDRP
jgi:hypothetical protein